MRLYHGSFTQAAMEGDRDGAPGGIIAVDGGDCQGIARPARGKSRGSGAGVFRDGGGGAVRLPYPGDVLESDPGRCLAIRAATLAGVVFRCRRQVRPEPAGGGRTRVLRAPGPAAPV